VENGWRLGKRVGESQEGVGRNPGEKGWGVKLGGLDAKTFWDLENQRNKSGFSKVLEMCWGSEIPPTIVNGIFSKYIVYRSI